MATLQQQKIRIRLKAFDRRLLDTSCEKIVDTANRTNATAIGRYLYLQNAVFTAYFVHLT